MNPYTVEKNGFIISTDKKLLDIDVIHSYLSRESYWSTNIPRDIVERSIAGAECFGVYHDQQQIGFARVITDKATIAYLGDVFILDAFRGKGLSKWLMEVIHAHPELQGLRRWLLGTRDAHTLYEQFGWSRFGEEQTKRFMQRQDRATY
ncbi:MAG: GNAT family N-acetyltransferase [Chitinophagaceae bacterium]